MRLPCAAYPRPLGRGLIEAAMRGARHSDALIYPRPLGRGLIEARTERGVHAYHCVLLSPSVRAGPHRSDGGVETESRLFAVFAAIPVR